MSPPEIPLSGRLSADRCHWVFGNCDEASKEDEETHQKILVAA
jgi:hypothetical protein